MGTRGIMGIRVNGIDKMQYVHFDCYPAGLGAGLVQQIQARTEQEGWVEKLKEQALALRLIDSDKEKPREMDITFFAKHSNLGVASQSESDWYCLLRECQGDLDQTLEAGAMLDAKNFINDSLFCEWAYILNLDELTFEVYKGFQKDMHASGRYAAPQRSDGYYPCALVATFPLGEIPLDWIAQVRGTDEDEEE